MGASFSPFDASLWFATAPPAPPTEPLDGIIQADVCVVGAGYTGLTTALELARKGVRVVVLEAQEAGFGGSGRNAGHCTPTFVHYSLAGLRQLLGEPWAGRLIARQTQANGVASAYIRDYGIACDWRQNGYVQAAARPGAIPQIEEKVREYNAAGARTRLIDKSEVARITGSPRSHGGWFHEEGAHLQPLAYARGLAHAVIREGGAVCTGSPVTAVTREGSRWRLASPQGAVLADKVIMATGAYTVRAWPGLERSFRIMRVFVAATQPLSDTARARVLPANTTMHDGRGDIFVYKYDGQGRIVASMFPMGARGGDPAHTRRVLTERLRWMHPDLSETIEWPYLWFGELDMQQRTIPRLYGLAPGVIAVTGLSGRGVPTGTMLGGVLSEWALGVSDTDLSLKIEPLHQAPLYMAFGPQLSLRYWRARDWLRSRLEGVPLPPHA